jgi:hypothetical protein
VRPIDKTLPGQEGKEGGGLHLAQVERPGRTKEMGLRQAGHTRGRQAAGLLFPGAREEL